MIANKILLAFAAVVLACVARYAWVNPHRQVTLPNGLILSEIRPWFGEKHDDLLTADGQTTLSFDIEGVCFDDRFVDIAPRTRGQGGLFDAVVQGKVSAKDHPEIFLGDGFQRPGSACNGYYTASLGPGLLYGKSPPFQPDCDMVNRANTALKDLTWFDRPCIK